MSEGKLYYLTTPDPNRPIEEQFVVEIDDKGIKKSFVNQENAIIFLYKNGIKKYKYLTKPIAEYINPKMIKVYEIWQIENRIGYVLYDYEKYVDENNEVKKKRAYIWRFVGFGHSCFAQTKEELKEKVLMLIHEYQEDPEQRGYNTYPFYSRYYLEPSN